MNTSGPHASLPWHLYVNVDNRLLGPTMPAGVTAGLWHGVFAREGQVLSCHVLLDSGAHWSGLPLHGLSQTHDFSLTPAQLMPWGAMGREIVVWHARYLHGLVVNLHAPVKARGRHTGLIVDWTDGYSRYPQEHKPLNLVALDTGQFGLGPNNFMTFEDAHFVRQEARRYLQHYRRGEVEYWEGDP